MKLPKSTIFLLLFPAIGYSAEAPRLIEIFIDKDTHVIGVNAMSKLNIEVRVYSVSGITELESKLQYGLPIDLIRAKNRVLNRLTKLRKETKEIVTQAWIARTIAARYGLTQYPAIVINNEFVVYGSTNLRHAIHRWNRTAQ